MSTNSPQRAFTLIETMVAITILSLAVAGPLVAASRAIVAADVARDQLTASFLAQEGIEYVRLMRDDAYLKQYQTGGADVSTAAWATFVSGPDTTSITQCKSSTCTFDPTQAMGTGVGHALQTCSGGSCTPLYLLPTGFYSQQSGISGSTQTPFTRTIQATDISGTEERVVSTVTWSFRGNNFTVTSTDNLTPWQ